MSNSTSKISSYVEPDDTRIHIHNFLSAVNIIIYFIFNTLTLGALAVLSSKVHTELTFKGLSVVILSSVLTLGILPFIFRVINSWPLGSACFRQPGPQKEWILPDETLWKFPELQTRESSSPRSRPSKAMSTRIRPSLASPLPESSHVDAKLSSSEQGNHLAKLARDITVHPKSPFETLEFQEPNSEKYLYIHSDTNTVHIMVPIVGGETIGIDNTCKTVKEFQNFFYSSNNIIRVLERYHNALRSDIATINRWCRRHESSATDSEKLRAQGVKARKVSRADQIWCQYSQIAKTANDIRNGNFSSSTVFPTFPDSFHGLLKVNKRKVNKRSSAYHRQAQLYEARLRHNRSLLLNAEEELAAIEENRNASSTPQPPGRGEPDEVDSQNLFAFVLKPARQDSYLRTREDMRVFTANRRHGINNEWDNLRQSICNHGLGLLSEIKSTKERFIIKLIAEIDGTSSLSTYQSEIKRLLVDEFGDSANQVDLQKDSRVLNIDEAWFDIVVAPFNELSHEERIATLMNACISEFFNHQVSESPFYNLAENVPLSNGLIVDDNALSDLADKISILVQFHLAHFAVACKAKGISSDFNQLIDAPSIANNAQKVVAWMNKGVGNIEERLLESYNLTNHEGNSIFTSDEIKRFNQLFRTNWQTVKDSPHFDEFIVCLPDTNGLGHTHHGNISIDFMKYLEHTHRSSTFFREGDTQTTRSCLGNRITDTNQPSVNQTLQKILESTDNIPIALPVANNTEEGMAIISRANYTNLARRYPFS